MFAQAEHKKTAQDLGIHSPPYPALSPQSPYPNLCPRGMRTEVVTKEKKTKQIDAPSGHAVRDTHRSGQIQAITTVAESHGRNRRSNRTTRPSAPAECGLRQAQKDKTNKAPSGHAVRDAHCSGQHRRRRQSPSLTG